MMQDKVDLVVGSDGFIGGALMRYLKRLGKVVIGTTRRAAVAEEGILYLDLLQDVENWPCPQRIGTAWICAGIAKIDICRHEPVLSARINVEGISALARNLVRKGAFVVYLSTNQVFDGRTPRPKADAPTNPITEYGRQRVEVEQTLGTMRGSSAIARFSKVLGVENELFSGWIQLLKNGQIVHPFSDMYIAPVPVSLAVRVLSSLGDGSLTGITQISGAYDISYADALCHAAQILDLDLNLIQPVEARSFGFAGGEIPRHTTLDMKRLKSVLGIEAPDPLAAIEEVFGRGRSGEVINKEWEARKI
jgi:dTDP-4-dehydrorhamnose reductase